MNDCTLCHSNQARVLASFPPYEVVRCLACGVGFLRPRPTEAEMQEVYARQEYFEAEAGSGYSDYRSQERSLRRTFAGLLRLLRRRGLTGGRLLELGCGYGYFLTEAAGHYPHRTATDYSSGAALQARATGAEIHVGGLDEVPLEQSFQLIAMIQVLEHLYEPVRTLQLASQRLEPGGAIVAAVPNLASPLRHLLGKRWPSYKIPEHLTYFDAGTLARTFREAGLARVEVLPYPEFFPLGLLAGKFGLRLPAWLGTRTVWVPTTSVACLGYRA